MGAFDFLTGGSKQNSEGVSGFAALPPQVQKAWLETALPKMIEQFNKPQRQMPMKRAEDPSKNPFASRALWDLQGYSDEQGGLFTPTTQTAAQNPYARGNTYGPPLQNGNNAAPAPSPQDSALSSLVSQFQNMVSENPGWDMKTNAPGVGQVRSNFMDDSMGFLKQNNITGGGSMASKALKALLGF